MNLQNIWATTDKPAIDIITKKYHHAPSTIIANDSGDYNSDLESLDSSYSPFVAVPKEFRPPSSIRMKNERPQMSLNENKQALSNKNPISVSKNTAEKAVPKIPLLPTPKLATVESKTIANQNRTQAFKKNLNISNHPKNLQKNHQNADAMTTAQKNTNVNKYARGNGNIFQPPKTMTNNSFQNYNKIVHTKEPKHENEKPGIQYEYIERQGTIQLHFEMPPKTNSFSNDGLKMGPKEVIRNREKQDNRKRGYAVSFRENKVKWVSSLNLNERNSYGESKTKQDFGKVKHKISYEKNTLKWDNSLNSKTLKSDAMDKIERDLSKKAQKVLYQENAIKWDTALSDKDSSSDTEGEIKWTIIQEKKTIISTKQIDDKNHTHKQISYERLPPKTCERNESGKSKRNHRKKNFNKYSKTYSNFHRNKTPKPDLKHTGNSVYKNDLQLNNNLKYGQADIENSNACKEASLDAETFTRQCRIREQNINKANPILTNNKPDVYSEKIDNMALKLSEEQKTSVLDYGREMADLIIGSHTALNVFISTFSEWKRSRLELISHFQHLEKNLKESSKKFTRYRDMLNFAKTSASLAAAVPLPHVSIAARVISVLTGLFSVFLSTNEKQTAEIEDSNEISIAAIRDTNASCDLYAYGLQCGLQFEDTAKLIEEFHSNAPDPLIFENESPELTEFLRGVLEYKPKHRIFYKKLHKCFQELLQNCKSEFCKRFCEPFLFYSSDIIDIVEYLTWRFRHEDFNGESVRFELQEIERLLESKETSIKELTIRIQNCIGYMQDELKFLEGCVKGLNLFDKSVQCGI